MQDSLIKLKDSHKVVHVTQFRKSFCSCDTKKYRGNGRLRWKIRYFNLLCNLLLASIGWEIIINKINAVKIITTWFFYSFPIMKTFHQLSLSKTNSVNRKGPGSIPRHGPIYFFFQSTSFPITNLSSLRQSSHKHHSHHSWYTVISMWWWPGTGTRPLIVNSDLKCWKHDHSGMTGSENKLQVNILVCVSRALSEKCSLYLQRGY